MSTGAYCNAWLLLSSKNTIGPAFSGPAFSLDTDRNLVSVSVSVTAPKLAIFLVSFTAVIVKHDFGLLSVTAESTTRFRREPKLSLSAIR